MSDLELENRLIQLRARLNEGKIKLWESPYITEERHPDNGEIRKLAETLGPELGIPIETCSQGLLALQSNALDKLQSKDEFQRTGIATVKIRVPTQGPSNREFDLKLRVTQTGGNLCAMIGQRLTLDTNKIKLVCAGKVVDGARTLQEQNISNGAVLMALIMAHSPEEALKENSTYDRVHKIRADAETLINESDSSQFLNLEDQEGNTIFLPKQEKRALLIGLALYEKGKAALSAENYEEALLLFLEADHDLCACNSKLLNQVDNYALLNLDIAWCYLRLKNLNQLPDADRRLQICEQKFRQIYGESLQRLVAIRGEQANEKSLLVRLHLLKAVMYFHQNKRDDARTMFRVVETELMKLRIDDTALSRLMECGCTVEESRIALRACSNHVEAAIEFIINRRQNHDANVKRNEREIKLYATIGHDMEEEVEKRIDLKHVDQLMEMGYPEELAALALKQRGNDINEALNELETNREGLQHTLLRTVSAKESLKQQLVALGFTPDAAAVALKLSANDLQRATSYLITNVTNGAHSEALERAMAEMNRHRNTNPSSSRGGSSDAAKREEKRHKKEMLETLFKSFSNDISTSVDSHLDLTLHEEAELLEQYKKLLGME